MLTRRLPLLLACLAVAGAASALAADVLLVARPAFPGPAGAVQQGPAAPHLRLFQSQPNQITDVRAWFRRNAIVPEEWDVGGLSDVPGSPLPSVFEQELRGAPIQRAIRDGDLALLVYGPPGGGRYLVGADRRSGEQRFALDLDRLLHAPGTPAATREHVVWAVVRDGVAYVQTAHDGYARDSRSRNAYLTAIDVASGKVRWRSPALVANGNTFVVAGNWIVSGYGFTDEPDALYALDRRTGKVVARLATPSSPDYLALRRGRLYVRTYDHDLVVFLGLPR